MKKIIALLLVVVLSATAAVGGTLAYLTMNAGDEHNVFSIGNIDVSLDEEVGVIGEGGEAKENEGGAEYIEVMPGDFLKKEVTVSNNGKTPAYVAITVKLNNAAAINAAIDDVYEKEPYNYSREQVQAIYDNVFAGWGINYNPRPGADGNDARGVIDGTYGLPQYVMQVDFTKTMDDYWLYGNGNWFHGVDEKANQYWVDSVSVQNFGGGYYAKDMNADEICYTYYAYMPGETSTTLFKGLNVPADFNADQLAMFAGLKIDIEAEAIQADNIPGAEGSEAEAKNAFSLLKTGEIYMPTTNWSKYADTTWFVNGETSIDTAEELAGLAKLVNEGTSFSGKIVTLAADIDLGGNLWTPIGGGNNGGKRFQGTFDGNGHTISNMMAISDIRYGNGLFGDITGGATIGNVTVSDAMVDRYGPSSNAYSGNVYGIVCGYAYGNVYFDNVHVVNSEVRGYGKVGTILGMAADPGGTTYLNNCSVTGTTVSAVYNAGGYIGMAQNQVSMTNCAKPGIVWSTPAGETYKTFSGETATEVNTGDTVQVNGTYWLYNGTYYYAGMADYYCDYTVGASDYRFADGTYLADGMVH